MQLMPLPATQSEKDEERFNLVATGKRVTVAEGDALAVGQKFTFNNLDDAGLLEADEGKKVRTRWSESLTLDGDAVRFDMKQPLDDPGTAFFHWNGVAYEPLDITGLAVGESMELADTSDIWASM